MDNRSTSNGARTGGRNAQPQQKAPRTYRARPVPFLRAWRLFRGLSQAALAQLTNLRVETINALEAGRNPAHPSTCTLLSMVLGVTPEDLHARAPQVEHPAMPTAPATRAPRKPAAATRRKPAPSGSPRSRGAILSPFASDRRTVRSSSSSSRSSSRGSRKPAPAAAAL